MGQELNTILELLPKLNLDERKKVDVLLKRLSSSLIVLTEEELVFYREVIEVWKKYNSYVPSSEGNVKTPRLIGFNYIEFSSAFSVVDQLRIDIGLGKTTAVKMAFYRKTVNLVYDKIFVHSLMLKETLSSIDNCMQNLEESEETVQLAKDLSRLEYWLDSEGFIGRSGFSTFMQSFQKTKMAYNIAYPGYLAAGNLSLLFRGHSSVLSDIP